METILALLVGLGLSAACGFRVFVPLLGVSLAAHSGHATLASDFTWLGSTPALIALSVATVLEIMAYYVPWMDHFLDVVATPAAIVAGIMVSASMMSDMSPFLRWSLAIIAGGGVAGAVQTTTVITRGASTWLSGGLTNPLVASAELAGSLVSTTLALWMPALGVLLAFAFVAGLVYWACRRMPSAPKQI